jgi:hypothetical protein
MTSPIDRIATILDIANTISAVRTAGSLLYRLTVFNEPTSTQSQVFANSQTDRRDDEGRRPRVVGTQPGYAAPVGIT